MRFFGGFFMVQPIRCRFSLLRRSHPETPVVLVESIVYANAHLVPAREARHADSSRQIREVWRRLTAAGDEHLHLISAGQLLGADVEDTVDGTHPTDLGFWRMAKGMLPLLERLLESERGKVSPTEGPGKEK